MNSIRMVVADRDERYIDKLTEYIHLAFFPRIRVFSFSDPAALNRYWSEAGEKNDVLLADPSFLETLPIPGRGAELVALLTEGTMAEGRADFPGINKYQPGDRIVRDVTALLQEVKPETPSLQAWAGLSRLLAVYSPAGGVGKTSFVLGLAAELAAAGSEVLCLSLETINSLVAPLTVQGKPALTYLLLALRENPDLVANKVKHWQTDDPVHQFHFLEPAESFTELADLTAMQLSTLLREIQASGRYDVILIDTDSGVNDLLAPLFQICERVFLVQTPDPVCRQKIRSFLTQADRVFLEESVDIRRKLVPIVNKCQETGLSADPALSHPLPGIRPPYRLPFIADLWQEKEEKYTFDGSRRFRKSMMGLVRGLQVEGRSARGKIT